MFFILNFSCLSCFCSYNFEKYYPIYKEAKPLLIEDLKQVETFKAFFGAIKGLSRYLTVSNIKDKEEVQRVSDCVKVYEELFAKIPLYKAKKFIHAFESVFCESNNYRKHVLVCSAVWSHNLEINAMRVFLKTVANHFLELSIDKTVASHDWVKYIRKQKKHFSRRCMRINYTYKRDVSLGKDYSNSGGDALYLAENKKNN